MLAAEELSRLLLLLYESASSPERVPEFLEALAQAVNAKAGHFREDMFHVERGTRIETTSLFESVGYSAESLCDYQAYYFRNDPFLQRVLDKFRDAECGVGQVLIGDSELRRTEFYSDWCRRHDIGRIMWAKLWEDTGSIAALSMVRGLEAPHFDEEELQIIAAIAPHLRQASRLARSLRELQSSIAMLQQSLNDMDIAISLVRRDGSMVRSTEGAERIFRARDGIWLHNKRLRTLSHAEQGTLDALIAGACQIFESSGLSAPTKVQLDAAGGAPVRSWTAQPGGTIPITRKMPGNPLLVVVSPFRAGSLMNEPQAVALVQFSDPSAVPRSRGAILRTLYGLTPTESRMADLLLQGLETREVAEKMGTTIETTRINLKRILAKTETRRQPALMRLMLSLPGK